tara:strand:+ start:149 stop:1165 length:1017 start_codon:yes stop_codon:yes gene_type:complete
MAIVINGSGTVTGISVGGLPDDIVDSGTLASDALDSAVTINDTGADVDFRVESDTLTHALFVEGSDGKVGIGAAPDRELTVSGGNSRINILSSTSDASQLQFGDVANSQVGRLYYEHADNSLRIHTNDSEQMRIDSAGFVGINNTAPNAQLVVEDERSGSIGTVLFKNTHASVEAGDEVLRIQFSGDNDCTGGHFINFFDSGGDIGGINCASASTVAYATTSDYRFKENIVDITTPITKLKALKPKSFNFIKTPSITQDGFLAHELADVVPIAVSGEKDATKVIDTYDEDGKVNGTETVIDSQGVDTSFVVPLLVGALQEAIAKIEILESKVTVLENA